jgi:predicted phage-related endonuclease
MKKQEHKQEILKSRTGGFGGSDARLFYTIASKGVSKLSATDLFRISVAKGERELKQIPETPAMAAGHAFEDYVEKLLKKKGFEREVELNLRLSDKFDTFAHADFYNSETKTVIECKFTQGNIDKTYNSYYAQLQWYYLLGAERVILYNGHGDVNDMLLSGTVENVEIEEIERDNIFIDSLHTGIVLLTSVWDDLRINVGEEWTPSDLLAFDAENINLFTDKLRQIEKLEADAKELREQIKGLFELYNIKSLKSDNYLITYVGESVRETLDTDKLKKEHKEIDFSLYKKQSKVKSSIKIKLY